MEALEIAAFTFPVSDRIADEFEGGYSPEVGYWENGVENSLKTGVFAFLRQHVHLEEPLV
jgi:hypothetical protein